MTNLTWKSAHARRSGFSLLEVMISLFLVGTIMVVALEALTAATAGRTRNGNQAQGVLLAQSLLQEILDHPYLEPDDTAVFGPETSETAAGTRATFDDVDDYHGWSASPPESKDGTDLSLSSDWTRKVEVQWVQPNDMDVDASSDDGLKQVIVSVEYKGNEVAMLSAVVTQSRQVLPLEGP